MIECALDEDTGTMTCRFPVKKMDTAASIEADKIFQKFFLEAAAKNPASLHIIFDLDGVSYVASSFLRLCVSAANKVEKDDFMVINTDPQIMKVFKIAGLDLVLKVS